MKNTDWLLDEFTTTVFVNRPCERIVEYRAYCVDNKGNSWWWNAGWRICGKNMRPLGHAEFRRVITLATVKEYKHELKVSRPEGMWRRVLDVPYEHRTTGEMGRVICTDGVHAVFRFRHRDTGKWEKKEVMFNNLNECKPSQRVVFERQEKDEQDPKRAAKTQIKASVLAELRKLTLDDLLG